MPNRYSYGPVVPDPSMFFGREAVLRGVCTRLENMGSTSIVGLRRIGKSSLLRQLEWVLPGRLGQNYVPVYVDLHDPHYHTVAGFVNTIATRLDRSIGGALGVQAVGTLSEEDTPRQNYLVKLRQILDRCFDEGELRTLCFDLAVDYDDLPGEGRRNKARELVIYLERRGRIPKLARIGARRRPNESWQDTFEPARGVLAGSQDGPFGRVREIFRARQPREKPVLGTVTDMTSFAEMLEILRQNGIRPVLCLDEFEEFIQPSAEFDDHFLNTLRSLGAHSKLALVVASRTPLVELRSKGRLTSPFHNIFRQVELGLLEPDAARDLRRTPFERDGISLTPEHEELVEELGGRHPFFLQMACHHLYETLSGQRERWADLVRESFNHDAESYFDDLWDRLDAHEQAALGEVIDQDSVHTGQVFSLARVLSALRMFVGQGDFSEETVRVLKRLERWGVFERGDGGWQPFSRAFTEYIRQNRVPRR